MMSPSPFARRRLAGLGFLLVLVTALAAITEGRRIQSALRDPRALSIHHDRWLSVTDAGRWTVPRLTGFDRHRPCPRGPEDPGQCRDDGDLDLVAHLARLEAAAHRAAADEPTAAALHTLGLFELSVEKLDAAIETLGRAAELAPTSALVASDLAAAYWMRAQAHDDPVDLLDSLAQADRSLELNPTLAAARWNRALALEALFLDGAAVDAFDEVAGLGEAGWAEDAAARAAPGRARGSDSWSTAREMSRGLSGEQLAALVDRHPQAMQDHVRDVALPRWAREPTDEHLAEVERLAACVAEATGDREPLDAVLVVTRASAAQRGELARLHRRFAEARELYLDQRRAESAALWPDVERELRRLGSPFADWAAYHAALCAFGLGEAEASLTRLRVLQRSVDPESRPVLIGQVEWMIGLIQVTAGQPASGMGAYQRAIERLDSVRALGSAAFLRMLLGDAHARLGDQQEAWRHVHAALEGAHHIQNARWLRAVYAAPTDVVGALGHARLAPYFSDLAVRHARRSAGPNVVAEALIQRAELFFRSGRPSAARQDLRAVRNLLDGLSDRAVRAEVEMQIQAADVAVLDSATTVDRRQRLDAAIEYARRSGRDVFLPGLLARRAGLHDAEALDDRIDDLERAGAAIDRQREALGPLSWRLAFEATHRRVLEDLLFARLTRGDPGSELLALDERLRGVALDSAVDSTGRGGERIRHALPERAALVSYAVLDDRIVAWCSTRAGLTFDEVFVPLASLERAVRIAGDAKRPVWRTERARSQLFDWLLAPFSAQLDRVEALVIAPDGPLGRVPFGLLIDRRTGEHLVDRLAGAMTLSASSMGADPSIGRREARDALLVVGDPEFSPTHYPELQRLPGAASEAATVARLYPRHTILIGDSADREALLAALENATRFHYAGHAVVVADFPERSRLVLASSATRESADLDVEAIRALDLGRLDLAVLSGCETAIGSHRDGRGTSSLAGAFLHAGVESVVATWTRLDDVASVAFFTELHRRLERGEPPARAVAALQRERLQTLHATDSVPWVGVHVVTTDWSSLSRDDG